MPAKRNDQRRLKLLGSQLRRLRMEQGRSLREVGNDFEVDSTSVSRAEQGMVNIGFTYLWYLSAALNTPLSSIILQLEADLEAEGFNDK